MNVAGGWAWRVVRTDRKEGYWSQLSGLAAFMEAFGGELPANAEARMGPFSLDSSPYLAYHALARRLLATLAIVSRAALVNHSEGS